MTSARRPLASGPFQYLLFLALTAIFVGYFMVWLPNEAAGLSFIGLEMGEEAKFLPGVSSGAILPGRSLFYVPPVTLALILLLLSAAWPSHRWQTWAARGMAVLLSMLAFPALEALNTAPGWQAEWLWRLLMIGCVFLVAAAVAAWGSRLSRQALCMLIMLVSLAGAMLPTWVFFEVRAAFNSFLPNPVGVGPGLWLNLIGHLGAALLAAACWRQPD